jgi:hypothetical protein
MEFPLYQWAVAKTLQLSDASLPTTARLISLGCFYLCLPAVFLLLRRIGATGGTALLALALVLSSPLYVFYSRAILIEPFALLLSLWFLGCFDRLARAGRPGWIIPTILLGMGAALVKVTTFAVWGGLALAGGIANVIYLWIHESPRLSCRRLIMFAVAGIIPLLAGLWWVRWADTVKQASPGGFFLTSDALASFNLGTWANRTDGALWQELGNHATSGLLPGAGWAALVLLWILPAPGKRSRWVPILAGATGLVWFCFPELYRIHDYYFYAMGTLPLAALALGTQRWFPAKRFWWLPLALTLGVTGLQWRGYQQHYASLQNVNSPGGNSLFDFIHDATRPEEVVIVVGHDWSATIGYYTQRRTVMFKKHVHDVPTHRERMLASVEGLEVAGLLVMVAPDDMPRTVATIIDRLQLDPQPTFEHEKGVFHASLSRRGHQLSHLQRHPQYLGVSSAAVGNTVVNSDPILADLQIHDVSANQTHSIFSQISPSPARYRVEFGLAQESAGSGIAMGAHPQSDFWINWTNPTVQGDLEFGLFDHTYADETSHSDGVWFRVHAVRPDGTETLLWERWVDPWNEPSDRGTLREQFTAEIDAVSALRFSTRPGPTKSYDSAFWGQITVR